jgi:hypothetical protein
MSMQDDVVRVAVRVDTVKECVVTVME